VRLVKNFVSDGSEWLADNFIDETLRFFHVGSAPVISATIEPRGKANERGNLLFWPCHNEQ
jgi:hypothetical protein